MAASTEKDPQSTDPELQEDPQGQEEDPNANEYLHGKALFLVSFGFALAIFLMALDQTIVANALPPIASQFNALGQITWIPTAFLLTQAPALPIFGQLSRLFNTKWLFMFSIFMFELGSLLSGVSTNVEFLIAARAVQGVGAAGIFVCAISMAGTIIPLKDRPKYFGLFGGIFAISGILGPLLGGAFVDHLSWRWCFYINLPLAVPTVVFSWIFLPSRPAEIDIKNPPPPPPPGTNRLVHTLVIGLKRLTLLDWVGAILSTGATTCFVLALQWGGVTKPWSAAEVVAPLVLSAVLLAVFIWWQFRRGDTALIPMKLFKRRTQIGATMAALFTRLALFVAVYELPLYYQAVKDHSPTQTGIDLIPITIALVLAAGIFGFLSSKIGRFWHIMVIGPLVGAVGFGIMFKMDEFSKTGFLIGAQILIGVGIGSTLQNSLLAVQADTTKDLLAQATGVVSYAQFLGGTIGVAVAGGVFASKLRQGLETWAPTAPVELLRQSVEALKFLPPDQHAGAIHAYVAALRWAMAPLGIATFVACSLSSMLIRNIDLHAVQAAATAKPPPASPKESETATMTGHGPDLEVGSEKRRAHEDEHVTVSPEESSKPK